MELTAQIINASKPKDRPYKLTDGTGLYLHILPNGAKYWRYNYRFGSRQRTAAYGVFPKVTLAQARQAHEDALYLLRRGIDPIEEKRKEKNIGKVFEDVAREWYQLWKVDKNSHYAKNIISRLEDKLFTKIGKLKINELKSSDFIKIINNIVAKGDYDVAKRTLQVSKQIMRYAFIQEYIAVNPITELYPQDLIPKRKKRNHARVTEAELPKLIADINNYDGGEVTVLAIRLMMHTFIRTSELIKAPWSEIDLKKKQWLIPAERMKKERPHIVPLTTQSISILERLHQITGDGNYLFPHERWGHKKHMSNNTILYALYRMGYKSRMTGHGFRGIASTILHENGFNSDYIELQLAHDEDNEIKAAYNHATYLNQRTDMMQWWSDFLTDHGD